MMTLSDMCRFSILLLLTAAQLGSWTSATPHSEPRKRCNVDRNCSSSFCNHGVCVPCRNDSNCPSNQFCYKPVLPSVLNKCVLKFVAGHSCDRDGECKTEQCNNSRCVGCKSDSDCPLTDFCNVQSGMVNQCHSRLDGGSNCVRGRQCSLDQCIEESCLECENDSHCPEGFCKNDTSSVNMCKDKLRKGECNRNRMCLSGICRRQGRCKKHKD